MTGATHRDRGFDVAVGVVVALVVSVAIAVLRRRRR